MSKRPHDRWQTALAFDWGRKYIGVAVVRRRPRLSVPIRTIEAKRGQAHDLDLDTLRADHSPDLFIVGLPKNMDDSESAESRHAKRFGRHLQTRYQLPVDYVDERLTTREAIDRTQIPRPDHSVAAMVIGEAWLNELLGS